MYAVKISVGKLKWRKMTFRVGEGLFLELFLNFLNVSFLLNLSLNVILHALFLF